MHKITLLTTEKPAACHFTPAFAEYEKRLSPFARLKSIALSPAYLPENPTPADIDKALSAEAAAITKHTAGFTVALCVEGAGLSSEAFAALVKDTPDITFVIGSSHGLHPSVKAAADLRLSLGTMTLPHKLSRLVLLEQLYRAACINTGKAYHK